ncbi:methyl-accepting chemotaxis protein [Chryseolinea lacunae]|uniref:MCP four helix bundle domain-containing protein n=1 Tax=Chryseolinea lacunae TaxID=2801331 RepID=A0ABS1KPK1_9BACT|nr:methyl-accepting chemotaxis protein [Chryseolinea lacunae]MBL0740617.1 MCP four helix bundle domain-containing protein [Chryseolinea lacunae]
MKLSIKARLIAAFTVLVALSGAIFYLGNSNANVLNDRINSIVDLNVTRLMLAAKASEDIQFITKREKELILTKNIDDVHDYIKMIEDRAADMTARIDQLKGMSDEKGIEILENFSASWTAYQKVYAKVKTLSLTNTDSTADAAFRLSSSEGREAAMGAVSALAKIVKKNENALALAKTEADQVYADARTNMITLLIIAVAISIGLSYWIITSISKSIQQAKVAIKSISEGDLTITVENTTHDEVGELVDYLKNMIEKLKEVLTFVSTASDHIATASSQMSSTSQQMSQGSQEQAASAEEISSSMEQMVSNIQQNTDNAQQTEKIASKAADDIQEGSRSVNQTVDSMKKIAEKISIIGEIARQTNLLALNAAVEAARAGDHGKGFAVVAAEVRKLAERSQVAAAEINELSSSSVSIADKSGKLLEQIVPNIQSTSKLVQEISASSIEQNTGANQVNTAIQQFNQIIQQNAAASEEMATGSEELSSQAEHLRETISFFKIDKTHSAAQRASASKSRATAPQPLKTVSKVNSSRKGIAIDMSTNGHADALDNAYEKY